MFLIIDFKYFTEHLRETLYEIQYSWAQFGLLLILYKV